MWIQIGKPKDTLTVTVPKALQALQWLINPEHHPVYMHCLDGCVVTGVIIMCLRKLQMWNMQMATVEYLRYLRDGVIGSEEQEFVEKFSPEMDIPYSMIPLWLWGGRITFKKHPMMKLRSVNPAIIDSSVYHQKTAHEDQMKEEYRRAVQDLLNETSNQGDGLEEKKIEENLVAAEQQWEDEEDDDSRMSKTVAALALEGWK